MSTQREDAPDAGWWRCGDEELLDQIAELEREDRLRHARMLRAIGELDRRGVARDWGHRDTAALLHDRLAITTADAKRRVQRAGQLEKWSIMGAAADTGVLHPEHITVIVDTLAKLPPLAPELYESTQRILVQAAHQLDPLIVRRLGREILAREDQDGSAPHEDELATPRNEVRYTVKKSGRVVAICDLEPETGALFTGTLSALSTPRGDEGRPDRRTLAERHGDALADVFKLVTDSGELPEDGGQKPHLTVTLPWDVLRDQVAGATLHTATLEGGLSLKASQARRIACDARILPMVLGSRSEPLDVGRSSRTIPTAIRKALVFRDRGCAFPSCDRPPQWTNAHHRVHVRREARDFRAEVKGLCRRIVTAVR
jgi:hypothetical protein